MKMRISFSIILLFFWSFSNSQISMLVKELPTDKYKYYVPDNDEATNYEYRYPGHIIEITISNTSDKHVSLPIDTASYAIPFTDNIELYYNGKPNIISKGDLYNVLGAYPFIYQKGIFKDFDAGTDPFYEEEQLIEKRKIENARLQKIKEWKETKKITDELFATYNWYMMTHMVTILPHEKISYKLYFNPFLKKMSEYSDRLYCYQLDSKIPYNVTFNLILNKNLYQFLTIKDKKKYPDLFIGTISSNSLIFK